MTTAHSEDFEIDPQVRSEVARIYLEWIGLETLSPDEQNATIDAEAARLTAMISEEMGDTAHGPLMVQWRQQHPGQDPDFATTTALMATAQHSARQKILAEELYPQLTPEQAEQRNAERRELAEMGERQAQQLRQARDPHRWKTSQVEVSELAHGIVDRVWQTGGDFEFRLAALALIQQRLEDNLPVPKTGADPLREEIEEIIDEHLQQVTPS